VLAELRAELRARLPNQVQVMPSRDIDRRRAPRVTIAKQGTLRLGALGVPGIVRDVGGGGLFLQCDVLVEANERGVFEVLGCEPAPVRVAWIRGLAHPLGQGIGMAFDVRDAHDERRALELVLALLDSEADGASAGSAEQEPGEPSAEARAVARRPVAG
jgi:hypothetical protein